MGSPTQVLTKSTHIIKALLLFDYHSNLHLNFRLNVMPCVEFIRKVGNSQWNISKQNWVEKCSPISEFFPSSNPSYVAVFFGLHSNE